MKKAFILSFIIVSVNCIASVFNGEIKSFKQPDGSSVDVKLFGTEYYMRGEGLDGYTLIRDKKSSWICYAKISEDGSELESTGIIYGATKENSSSYKKELPFQKHIDLSSAAKKAIIKHNRFLLSGGKSTDANEREMGGVTNSIATTPIHEVSGNIKGLCIVVDFPDQPGTLPISSFDAFCNSLNYTDFGNQASLRSFYSDISGGLVDYQNVVFGYYHAPLNFTTYDSMPFAQGAQQILGEALHWIDSIGFDFSTLSINPDGTIQAINLMYTGYPPNWAQGMWFHKGNYTGFSADGVYSNDYNCSPANDPLELGVVAHENGHMIGKWPDTYEYDAADGPDGLGTFDLMCWYGDPLNPDIPNPLFLSNVGWDHTVDVTFYNGLNLDTANSFTVYKYRNLNDTNEFFLLQARRKLGHSAALDDEGLTIWHIDRNGDNQSTHHEVYLVPASNDYNNHTQACFKQGFNEEFSASTTPDSRWFNGDPSGLRVWAIGPVADTMNYKLGSGTSGPALNLIYNSWDNDNNANGFMEAGETLDIHLDASNFGQITSGTATVTCVPFGVLPAMVTVNTGPQNIGAVNVLQSIPVTFNISIDPSAVDGSYIKLQFFINDGVDSLYITKQFLVGVIIPMNNNSSVTSCTGVFYDEGLDNNYLNNTNYTKTFYPAVAGQYVSMNFQEFGLEDYTNCGYDYFNIFDGPSTADPLIGTYCGNNSPGIITSSHSSGALTFKFHADEGVNDIGWKALISCSNVSGINEIEFGMGVVVYPNPSNGLINVYLEKIADSKIVVTDMLGRNVYAIESGNNSKVQIDLSSLDNGLYILTISSGGESFTQKISLNK